MNERRKPVELHRGDALRLAREAEEIERRLALEMLRKASSDDRNAKERREALRDAIILAGVATVFGWLATWMVGGGGWWVLASLWPGCLAVAFLILAILEGCRAWEGGEQ